MCGRYTLRAPKKAIAQIVELPELPFLQARYNIAPTQRVPVVRVGPSGPECVEMRWGLIPRWATDAAIGQRLINARSDTVASKPAFRSAFRHRRCLVPADGFYEWKKVEGKKQPYLIRVGQDEPFAFAGLWETWENEGKTVESCTILTTDANESLRALHERMPVILTKENYQAWLDVNEKDPAKLEHFLRSYPADAMNFYTVSPLVNNARNEDPRCAEPAAGETSLFDMHPESN